MPLDVEREIVRLFRRVHRRDRAADEIGHAGAARADVRIGETAPQRRIVLVERQPANALVGRRHQHRAEIGLRGRPADRLAAAAVAPGGGSHAKPPLGVGIEARRPGIAGIVDRVGDPLILAQSGLGPARPQASGISGRSHAGGALEQAMEMVGRIADAGRQLFQRRRFLGRGEQGERLLQRDLLAIHVVRLAAQAGAVAGGAGRRRRPGRTRHSRASAAAPGSSAGNRCRWSSRRRPAARPRSGRAARTRPRPRRTDMVWRSFTGTGLFPAGSVARLAMISSSRFAPGSSHRPHCAHGWWRCRRARTARGIGRRPRPGHAITRVLQHAVLVEAAQAEGAAVEIVGRLVDKGGRLRALADVDRISGAERRRHVVRDMVEQHQLLAGRCIFQRDAAGIAARASRRSPAARCVLQARRRSC